MIGIGSRINRAVPLCFILMLSVFPSVAGAHVTEGHMPDAVAEVEYKILLEFKPKDIDTLSKLAFVLMRQDKLKEAEKLLDRAAKVSSDDERVLEALIALRIKQQRIDDALDTAKRALKIHPEAAILYLHYGTALLAAEKTTQGREAYRKGLNLTTDGKNDHARRQLEEALAKLENKKPEPANAQ